MFVSLQSLLAGLPSCLLVIIAEQSTGGQPAALISLYKVAVNSGYKLVWTIYKT